MTDQQWQEAWQIFRTVQEINGEARRSYLASLQTDPVILEEVISMLEEPAEPTPPQPVSKIGSRFGHYEISGILGSGGMGQVYSAHDPGLGRKAAMKFLSPQMRSGRSAVDRLVREAKAASALNHPHIVTVYEVIHEEDEVAIAMELVEGVALSKFCGEPQEISRVMDWGRQIAQALAAAHQQNIIHRDIKPDNVMVREDGIVKVLDFGLARHPMWMASQSVSATMRFAGTLIIWPRTARGETARTASDVFSWDRAV
jgi:serine/threonine protein kinase